ncbi:MAG TPA: A/G-specific adenine glycosylase [Sphingomicrobium sp.]|jgi:A/G-specific adenine glycosylase
MLQQTTVATVKPRFERFVARWPTIEALAAARDEDILSEWAGLGYYARARNLIACAREVAARGRFPETAAELRKLPGIGAYTSAAIAAIAFGEKAPAVDTNVERVIARHRGLARPSRDSLERHVLEMMDAQAPGEVVQALMDLGAGVCRPRQPRCNECPLRTDCIAHASGDPESFSTKRQRKARPHRHGVAWWIERDDHVWLVRRPPNGLLGGMAALPGGDWSEVQPLIASVIGSVRHVFTHFSLDLAVETRTEPVGEGWWQPLDRLDDAGLPTLYRRAAELALERRTEPRAAA